MDEFRLHIIRLLKICVNGDAFEKRQARKELNMIRAKGIRVYPLHGNATPDEVKIWQKTFDRIMSEICKIEAS